MLGKMKNITEIHTFAILFSTGHVIKLYQMQDVSFYKPYNFCNKNSQISSFFIFIICLESFTFLFFFLEFDD